MFIKNSSLLCVAVVLTVIFWFSICSAASDVSEDLPAGVMERLNNPALFERGKGHVYSGEQLEAIRFPVGGIGTGTIQLDGEGQLLIWQIFNNFTAAFVPHSFFAVRAKKQGQEPVVKALQISGVGPFKPMKSLTFESEYPFAWYNFEDDQLPLQITMRVFSPFIPMRIKDSSLPCAIFDFLFTNVSNETIEAGFLASQQNTVGYDGNGKIEGTSHPKYGFNKNIVKVEQKKNWTAVNMRSAPLRLNCESIVMTIFDQDVTAVPSWKDIDTLFADFQDNGKLTEEGKEAGPTAFGETLDAALAKAFTLQPGKTRCVRYALVWYSPDAVHGTSRIRPQLGFKPWIHKGNFYSQKLWYDPMEIVDYLAEKNSILTELTQKYHDALYSSNLPYWLLDLLSSQAATLRSKTCFWAGDGYFGSWEGCSPERGCCPGNCAHVWHYAQLHARLFPSIARRMRQQAFACQNDDGGIPFRQPAGKAAFDGQCGEILSAYREHLLSKDGQWLAKYWPNVKKAMEYVILQWDSDEDGVLVGPQWNTMDWELGGSTTWLGSLYLAALEASEKMAVLQGDSQLAERYNKIWKSGAKKQDQTLWNGEYYIQVPDPIFEPALREDYGNACFVDQLLGQWWANQLGLGLYYPPQHIRQAMRSLLKYNFHTNFHGVEQKPRKFVHDDDAGMLMCAWPKNDRPPKHIRFADEVWTGQEYAVAATMIHMGMLKGGLMVAKAVSDRYDGRLRTGLTGGDWASWGYSGNPFSNEECGKFYSRAMSVWSILLALQGFIHDGPAGVIGFKPVWSPSEHRTFFSANDCWGVFQQQRKGNMQFEHIEVSRGKLSVRKLIFELPQGTVPIDVKVSLDKELLDSSSHMSGNELTITLKKDIVIYSKSLLVSIQTARKNK